MKLPVLLPVLAALIPAALPAADFYVNTSGLDTDPGTSAQPWRTLARVNQQDLAPGDRVFLAGGQTFTGLLDLTAEDAGTATSPVTIDSYGTGRATLSAGNGGAISIYNAGGFRIRNLVLLGAGKTVNTESGLSAYHDVANTLLSYLRFENIEASGFGDHGISVGAYNGSAAWQDVAVTGCVAHANLKSGIFIGWSEQIKRSRNITIASCTAYDNTGDPASTGNTGSGIILADTDGGLVEHCIAYRNGQDNRPGEGPVGIWTYNSNAIVIQHCESYDNRTSGGDGGGFDLDQNTSNSTIQYCYSHNNAGAGYLIYDGDGGTVKNTGNVVRYNISQNDGRRNNYPASAIFADGSVENLKVYGNTFYMNPPSGTSVPAIKIGSGANLVFYNNIIQTTGSARLIDRVGTATARFEGNAYWSGTSPFVIRWTPTTSYSTLAAWRTATTQEQTSTAVATGYQTNPLLTAPGAGSTIGDTTQHATLSAYRLQASSPLIHAGRDLVAAYGIAPGPRDFYGNAIPAGSAFDIGAHEYTAPPSPYDAWRATHFTPAQLDQPAVSGPDADPDGDGLNNLLEYAFDSLPLDPASALPPVVSLTPSLPQSLQLTFVRHRADLRYEVLASSDLAAAWQVIATDPGQVGAEVTVTDPVSASPRRFLRLRIVAP
ncbi:MAG: right-handed parallel beta-helix repeat-containing protein [Burkholderiales bacterium]|nr:right-handed parallel beta-helix repeat-containing protein [Opitutaceae bacterium]